MRKFVILTALFALTASLAVAKSQLKHLTVKSEILGVEKSYSVYLPDGYNKGDERYPVLYLLHGAKGTHKSWCRDGGGELPRIADAEIAEGRAQKMIVVMPDARGEGERKSGRNMGYFNVKGWAYEDFFFKEFIPHIDATFRTIASKEGRAIAGLSMGGGGAVVYCQHHPEVFAACYSTSGLLDILYRPNANEDYEDGWLWSVAYTSPVEFLRISPAAKIEALRSVRWKLDCGDDDFLIKSNIDFFVEMRRERVKVEFRVRNGAHNWEFWRESLPKILQFSFLKEQ